MSIITHNPEIVQPINPNETENSKKSSSSNWFVSGLKQIITRICAFVKEVFSRITAMFKSVPKQDQKTVTPKPAELRPVPIKQKTRTHLKKVKRPKPIKYKKVSKTNDLPSLPLALPPRPQLSGKDAANYVMEFLRKSYLNEPHKLKFQDSKTPATPSRDAKHISLDTKKLKTILNVDLRRQAKYLFSLLNHLNIKEEKAEVIRKMCETISQAANVWDSKVDTLSIGQAKLMMGKLILLTGLNADKLVTTIEKSEFNTAKQKIDFLYTKYLHYKSKKINKAYEHHQKTGLQDKTRVLQSLLASEIARCLIPEAGIFNSAIIPDVLKMLIPRTHENTPHYIHIKFVLQSLLTSNHLWNRLKAIQGPDSPHALATNLIAIAQELPQNTAVTDRDAQRTALAGLLAHWRQGKVTSCFASFLAIGLLSCNLELCLEDFTSLLRYGVLTRSVQGRQMQFPFQLSMSKDQVKRRIRIDSTGKLKGSKRKLWHAPGIISACKALGLESPEAAILTMLSRMDLKNQQSSSKSGVIETTVDLVLQNLAGQSRSSSYEKISAIGDLYLKALYAYESQTSNPLLQAWENVIANMAEGTENSYIKPIIIDSIQFALERKVKNNTDSAGIYDALNKILLNRIKLQFSPHIQHERDDDDGNSSGGAFILYDTHNSPKPTRWSQVSTPEAFYHFVEHVLDEIKCQLLREQQVDQAVLKEKIETLREYVATKKFILQTINKCGYHQVKNPIENWKQIDFTPWMFKIGTNFKAGLQIYFELDAAPQLEQFLPNTSKQLFFAILERVRRHKKWISESSHPNIRIPATVRNVHAFSLLPKHPSFWPLVCNRGSAEEALDKTLVIPGEGIAERKVLPVTRGKIISCSLTEMIKCINPKKTKSKKLEETATLKNAYIELTSKIPQNLSLKAFLDKLLEIHINVLGENVHDARIALDLDVITLKCLPEQQRLTLTESAIHIADTNWFNGVRNIHFCLMYNPRTGMELAKIDDNNENLTPICQNYWMLAHPWEFYP